jgi:hypothetical protein
VIFVNDILRVIQGGRGGSDRPQRPDGIIGHSEASLGNAADTTDDVLASIAIPAGILDNPGSVLEILARGHTAATANNKQIKLWFGPDVQTLRAAIVTTSTTLIATSGTVTTNNLGWQASAQIVKTGAYKANTQNGQGSVLAGTTVGGVNATVALTKDETKQQFVTITGASGTTGAANDVVLDDICVYLANGG